MKKVIVILKGNHPCDSMFEELYGKENVTVIPDFFKINNSILKLCCRIHHSQRVRELINIPFRKIWSLFYALKEYPFETNCEYIMLFYNLSIPSEEHLTYLNALRKKYNIKFALYLIDSLSTKQIKEKKDLIEKYKFDMIYTFDKEDAKQYQLGFCYTPCSQYKYEKNIAQAYSLYFCGWNKGRAEMLKKIADKMKKYGIPYYFFMCDDQKKKEKYKEIHYGKRISYKDNIENTLKANCILEIVQEKQKGSTLRYFEAVIYNKKLLTNNKEIEKYPFFNARYMRIFSDLDDIDVEWISQKEEIDYGYNGEFSPMRLIEEITKVKEESIIEV